MALSLVGCGSPQKTEPEPVTAPPRAEISVEELPSPSRRSLGMVVGESVVRVGDDEDSVYEEIPKPKGGFDVRDAAPVTGEGLRSRGWSTGDQTFVTVSKQGKVLLALWSLERVGKATLGEVLADQEARNETAQSVVVGEFTNYRFWEQGSERLMVCDTIDNERRQYVAVAVGHTSLMDALRMNPTLAAIDKQHAESTLKGAFAR